MTAELPTHTVNPTPLSSFLLSVLEHDRLQKYPITRTSAAKLKIWIIPPLTQVEEAVSKKPLAVKVQKVTQCPPLILIIIVSGIGKYFLWKMFNRNPNLFVNVFGMAWPTYKTLQLIQSNGKESEMYKWICYCKIISLSSIIF